MAADRKPRGELAELSLSLQSLCTVGKQRSDKDHRLAKKEVFKKVINYMTMGMDMSGLFPMMTSCANLSQEDIVLKKMLYLYLTHYATQTPNLALMAINQLHKDCNDQDPTIRGLALRSLCSLRLANLLEYLVCHTRSSCILRVNVATCASHASACPALGTASSQQQHNLLA
jgi:vesicle coat complex subunit